MVFIPKPLLSIYQIFSPPLGPEARGFVQLIRLNPLPHCASTHLPLNITTVHLKNGRDKIPQLLSLLPINPEVHHILGGDFNFIEHPSDASNPQSSILIEGNERKLWETVVGKLCLREIPQPTHTHYFLSSSLSNCRTSRIDRIYSNYSVADNQLTSPHTYITHTQHNILNNYRRIDNESPSPLLRHHPFVSDHLPITISFNPKCHNRKSSAPFRIPRWAMDKLQIRKGIDSILHLVERIECPYTKIDVFISSAKKVVKDYLRESRDKKLILTDSLSVLQTYIKLYSLCSKARPNLIEIQRLIHRHQILTNLIDISTSPIDTTTLRKKINSLITPDFDHPNLDPFDTNDLPPSTTTTKRQSNQTLFDDMRLESSSLRPKLTSLRPSETSPPTSSPEIMSQLVSDFWGGIWQRDP